MVRACISSTLGLLDKTDCILFQRDLKTMRSLKIKHPVRLWTSLTDEQLIFCKLQTFQILSSFYRSYNQQTLLFVSLSCQFTSVEMISHQNPSQRCGRPVMEEVEQRLSGFTLQRRTDIFMPTQFTCSASSIYSHLCPFLTLST